MAAPRNPRSAKFRKLLTERLSLWNQPGENCIAPLDQDHIDSVLELTAHVSQRPIPNQLPIDRVSAVAPPRQRHGSAIEDFGEEKIENAQQFYAWFSDMEKEMEKDEDAELSDYVERVTECRDQCDAVKQRVTDALGHLERIQAEYQSVSSNTGALHDACQELLLDQTKLVALTENINSRLTYFNELDKISARLSSPALTVNSDNFIPMLTRLDECIAYVKSNPQLKESESYLARFRQCLSRALSLIKSHVVGVLQASTKQVKAEKADSDNAFTLFYGKFRSSAPRVKMLMEQIEVRVEKSVEYEQLLIDCHQCYFNQREELIGASVTQAVQELAAKHARDHCTLVRSGFAFLQHVCQDEHQLFFHFFTNPARQLDQFLERLCNVLYDVLRPLIIHINHLETLTELCSILKIEMLDDHVANNPQALSAFEVVTRQMLEDVQERLVYRVNIYIQTDISGYRPAPGDLAYPDKLQMMESIAEGLKSQTISRTRSRNDSVSSTTSDVSKTNQQVNVSGPAVSPAPSEAGSSAQQQISPADLHGMWYPTVRRALVCLSKLYRCLDRNTFQGISQDVLAHCTASLVDASTSISLRKTRTDGQLFLIKHLLILREQIAPFQVDFAIKETSLDFSKMKNAAYGLLNKKAKLFALNANNSLLEFIIEGTPQVMETFVDSKKDVDKQLKKVCEEFIAESSRALLGPVQDLVHKVASFREMMAETDNSSIPSLREQPWFAVQQVQSCVAAGYRQMRQSPLQRTMALYLANRDTQDILFRPIKVNVQKAYSELHQVIGEVLTPEEQQIVACPSAHQINLTLAQAALISGSTSSLGGARGTSASSIKDAGSTSGGQIICPPAKGQAVVADAPRCNDSVSAGSGDGDASSKIKTPTSTASVSDSSPQAPVGGYASSVCPVGADGYRSQSVGEGGSTNNAEIGVCSDKDDGFAPVMAPRSHHVNK